MTTADIERLDEAKAFSATLSFEALERFHVPFDDLIGNDATEGRLGPLVRQGRRVAVRAASGEGKSSLITSVLGPLAIGEESPIFAIPVPVAGAADDTVTSSEAFFRYLLNVLARWSDRTELERRDRRRLDRLERDLRDRQETRHAGVTIPLWFLQPDLARDITTTVSAIGDYADALGTLRRAVELLRTAGKQPIVVFDDTDAWLQSVELDRKRLASGFFGGPFRTLAKDVDVGIVIAVHNSYADVPEYLAARELLDATIEVPRFDGRSHAAFTKILGQRVRQQLGDGVLLAELVETDAIEQVARFYQAGTGTACAPRSGLPIPLSSTRGETELQPAPPRWSSKRSPRKSGEHGGASAGPTLGGGLTRDPRIPPEISRRGKKVVLPCHSTRPPSTAQSSAFAQVDGAALQLPPLGTVLRRTNGEAPVHPTDPVVASLPVQRRLGLDEVTELVTAYREGVPVEKLAASFKVNRTTVLGHVRRHGVPKRDRRALRQDDVETAMKLYAEGRSAAWVAEELQVATSTMRRTLKSAGVTLRPAGRQQRTP